MATNRSHSIDNGLQQKLSDDLIDLVVADSKAGEISVEAKLGHVHVNVDSRAREFAKNRTLERETKGCYSLLFHTSVFVFVDVWRQITAYGMKYYNNDIYPIAQTQIVALAEFLKLFIFVWKLLQDGTLTSVKMSTLYFIPSFIYAVNSNIFFYAMHYTTPPIWNILTQLRVIFTALMYRVVFKRYISPMQWTALILLTMAIIIPDFGDTDPEENKGDVFITVVLAITASALTALGPLYTEYLFKNDERSFTDMQMQLYFYGSVSASILYLFETSTTTLHPRIHSNHQLVAGLIFSSILFTAMVGIATAYIMKRLDNIVKLYAQSISSMLMTLACVVMFPKRFNLDFEFLCALGLTFVAIFLYESSNITWHDFRDSCKICQDSIPKSSSARVVLLLIVFFSVLMILFLVSMAQNMINMDEVLKIAKIVPTSSTALGLDNQQNKQSKIFKTILKSGRRKGQHG